MNVKLKKEMKIYFEDQDEGMKTLILPADSITPVNIVTEELIKEYEIFEPYLGSYFIDIDKLMPFTCLIEDISQLIIDNNDFYNEV